ncbi:sensor histidine kinase [Amnibacterium endophyticum]|uniref:histidine kinase n=1 Tax=Amnibacterium endophyticum TaxID=2109337 RepID=A0ABW4LGG4_9MICO
MITRLLRVPLTNRTFRTLVAALSATLCFWTIWTSELGRNGGLAFVYAIPAVLVLVFWRTRPVLALALSLLALIIVLFGAANGTPVNSGGVLASATAWFVVLGTSLSDDRRIRIAGWSLLGLDALLALLNSGLPSFVIVLALGGGAAGIGWVVRQLREASTLQVALAETSQRGEAAERDVLVELERNRIAREVHDVVAHSLAVVIAQADGARFAAETKPETVAPALESISDTARRALGEVRTMLHDLRTSGDAGVVPGPADLAALVEGVRGLGVEVEEAVYGEPRRMERDPGIALYRVAQEALTNAMRHGDRARPVGFEVDWGERQVVLTVTNGVPDEALGATERAGHGVLGMRERAVDAGGDCSAGVGSNGRFRVRVALPLAADEPTAAAPTPPEAQPNPLLALFAPAEATGSRG